MHLEKHSQDPNTAANLLLEFPHHTGSWPWNRAVGTGGHTAVASEKWLWLSCFCLYSPNPQKAKMWPLGTVSSWHLCLPAAQWWWPRQVCQDLLWGWAVSTVSKKWVSAWLCPLSSLWGCTSMFLTPDKAGNQEWESKHPLCPRGRVMGISEGCLWSWLDFHDLF